MRRLIILTIPLLLIIAMLPYTETNGQNTDLDKQIVYGGNNATRVMELSITLVNIQISRNIVSFSINMTFIGISNPNLGIWIYEIILSSVDSVSMSPNIDRGISFQSFSNSSGRILQLIFLGSIISEGSRFELSFNGKYNIIDDNYKTILSSLILSSRSSLLSINVIIPQNYKVLGLTPIAHNSKSNRGNVIYSWNYLNISDYSMILKYKVDSLVNNLAFNSSQSTITMKQSEDQWIKILVTNNQSIPIKLEISSPKWFLLQNSSIINGMSTVNLFFKINNSLSPGTYTGIIYFSYNNEIIHQVETILNIQKFNNIAFIMVIFSSIGIIAMGLYQFRDKITSINKKSMVTIKSIESIKSNDVINKDINSKFDLKPFQKFLNKRDFEVIKFIDSNLGISQQQIANNFNLSKATISRVINKLENRGLVRRESSGMSNKIYIEYENFKSS